MNKPPNPNPKRPTCPDCTGDNVTEAPAESCRAFMCEECGRTFDAE